MSGSGGTVVHNFGFAAHRPRVHDLAYSLVYMVLALDWHHAPDAFDWRVVASMIAKYEETSGVRLEECEEEVLPGYMAAIPLYHAITACFLLEPLVALRSALSPVNVSEFLLDHPECLRDVIHVR